MRIILLTIIFILSFSSSASALDESCTKQKDDILQLLENATKCQSDSDCVVREYCICPFDSFYILNQNSDLPALKQTMEQYAYKSGCSYCLYDCMGAPSQKAYCDNGKCSVSFEQSN